MEALQLSALTVTEISAQASVSDLLVVNSGDLPVLLLDGEELAGAKQNRVINTAVLLSARSERIIPVSCTERGRRDAQIRYVVLYRAACSYIQEQAQVIYEFHEAEGPLGFCSIFIHKDQVRNVEAALPAMSIIDLYAASMQNP